MAVNTTELRARFALRLSNLYGTEVPAYTMLVEVSRQVNLRALARLGPDAERLGTIARLTAERHGAIRVGSPREMAQVARVFGAFGMYPTGFYDLRDAQPSPIPIVSTAFRPRQREELARNPFRVFTSMLVPEDRRFFDEEMEKRLHNFLAARTLFPPELLELADRAEKYGELDDGDAERLLELATASFALSSEPVDRAWYEQLERISGVAADIGGVTTTHINHLTPRVLDIDDLQQSMAARGIRMLDAIQGPPPWKGPDLLLRQTSFRALAETRRFREPDGTVTAGALRVRFGEVEQRGIALTPSGRDFYDHLMAEVDRRTMDSQRLRPEVALEVWNEHVPDTELELLKRGIAYFTYAVSSAPKPDGDIPSTKIADLVDAGWLVAEPIVYEDFLPRSAAGIFSSNLSSKAVKDETRAAAGVDVDYMAEAVQREVVAPERLYLAESEASVEAVSRILDVHLEL